MTGRGLLPRLKVGSLDNDPTIGHLADTHQEVLRLDLAANHLRIIVDLNLFRENATLLVLLLNELVPNLDRIHQCLVLADNLWLVLLEGHHDGFVGHLASLNL